MKNYMTMNKLVLMLMFLLTSVTGFAKEKSDDARPLGCRDVGYEYKLKTLKLKPVGTELQSLFFIFNSQTKPVNMYQMLKDNSTRSMYLNHTIQPREWAVLSTNEKELKYICTVDDPNLTYGRVVDCAENVKVCEYVRVKYGMNNKGNYWFVDSSRNGAVQQVLHYGIIPR